MTARLEAIDISFRYSSGPVILDGWHESFGAGEMVSITGKSGQGKSTLLYILGLMLHPVVGEVLIDGEPVRKSDRERARLRAHHFGFVFQDAALDVTRSVMDNVLEGALYRGADLGAARSTAKGLLQHLDVDVDPRRKPGQVSGGQAQRIALCRALLGSPPIVLADEPTGNLDARTAEIVMSSFREHAATGATVVMVTHDSRMAARCDRQVYL